MTAASDDTIPLAEQLRISPEEIKNMATRLNRMIEIRNKRKVTNEEVSDIYKDWFQIAVRMNKGREMIMKTYHVIPDKTKLNENERYRTLSNLYQFLAVLLGLYDMFFEGIVSPEQHEDLRKDIIGVLS